MTRMTVICTGAEERRRHYGHLRPMAGSAAGRGGFGVSRSPTRIPSLVPMSVAFSPPPRAAPPRY